MMNNTSFNLIVLELANVFLQITLFAFYITSLLKNKYKKNWTIFGYIGLQFFIYLCTIPIKNILVIKTPLFFLADLLFFIFLFKGTIRYKAFIWVMKIVFIVLSEIASIFVFNVISPDKTLQVVNISYQRVISVLFFNILFLTITIIFTLLMKKIEFRTTNKSIALFLLFPLNQILILSMMFYSNIRELNETVLIFGTLCLMFCVVVDLFLLEVVKEVAEKVKIDERLALTSTMAELELEHYNLMQDHMKEANALKHNFRDQLQTAFGLINSYDQKNKDEALSLLNAIGEKLEDVNLYSVCENKVVNTIVSVKKELAQKHHIRFDEAINIPENIRIEKIDLCTLFSNILNNAIEACGQVEENNRFITVKAEVISGFLIIKVTNSKSNEVVVEDGEIKTTKKDKKNHGFGVDQIKRISKKYDGNFNLNYTDSNFTLTVGLTI